MSVRKYLERYAEPEAALALHVPGRYHAAVVVPAHREPASSVLGLLGAHAPGRVLIVLVVNAAEDSTPEARRETCAVFAELERSYGAAAVLAAAPPLRSYALESHDLLVVDRASQGHLLPAKQGVGLARKIGADLALGLWAAGRVELPWLFSTDADVVLPPDYFASAAAVVPRGGELGSVGGLLFPFRHQAGGEHSVDVATELYELTLRYHVLGLRHAGSPYAYHSIGSALAVNTEAYAAVRGFPKRLAGEDFYLLDKLAKVSVLAHALSSPIAIRSRLSDRVPFGTGPRVRELCLAAERGEIARVYQPLAYGALGAVLRAFSALARTRDVALVDSGLEREIGTVASAAREALAALGFEQELERALAESKSETVLRRRLVTWFDALRTLRFIHGLRDRALPDVGISHALREAAFVPRGVAELPTSAALAELSAAERTYTGPSGVPRLLHDG